MSVSVRALVLSKMSVLADLYVSMEEPIFTRQTALWVVLIDASETRPGVITTRAPSGFRPHRLQSMKSGVSGLPDIHCDYILAILVSP